MTRIIEILMLVCLAGFFDYIMDMVKDFNESGKNWLWKWVQRHPEYIGWYSDYKPLPFFEKRGYLYKAGNVFLANCWHQAKHLMLLSFAGAVAYAFGTYWYYQIIIWWLVYYIEGEIFNQGYQRLKDV